MRPLAGIRVVTLAVNTPGPVAAARLHELGAEVTKVEPPGGDPLALACTSWYEELARGQRVVTLDLKSHAGRRELDDLLDGADVLLTSHRPSALARLSLSPDEVRAPRPRLVYVAIVGYAHDPERAGHDLTYAAEHALVDARALPRTLLADIGGAERAVSTTLALLVERARTDEGGYVEVALADAAAAFAAPLRHRLSSPEGALGGGLAVYGVYETSDGWIALAALEPHFRERVRSTLGVELTHGALAASFRERRTGEWEAWAAEHDVPLAAVRGGGTVSA